MSSRRKVLVGLLGLGMTVAGLTLALPAPAQANPAGTALVISEVYVNGGSTGATYKYKFVELYNPTGAAITFNGSVQYRAATSTGNATSAVSLAGVTIGSHKHFLIKGPSNGATSNPGAELPTPDIDGGASLNSAGGGGTHVSHDEPEFDIGHADGPDRR